MLRQLFQLMTLSLVISIFSITPAQAQELQKEYESDDESGDEYYDRVRVDRYLNVEVWTDHDDDEFYEGDRVKFYYRVSRDAFVVIYSIDSRGRVNLLFPSEGTRDNYVTGGVTYTLPGRHDDYDLIVNGPEGVENVQIIASREPFPIPDWYSNSGLFCDWEDRHEYMDWVNSEYFVKYEGQRFAYDRTALYVYEWEPEYFRPVYRPYYPNWTTCGNVYVDYWPGSSIYIDGIFWGVSPCYIPRIYVGWHTFTVYDHYNYCWEYDVHVTRYNTVVLDHTVIVTQPSVRSKYKTVRFAGYQDPVKAGYKDFDAKVKTIQKSGAWKTESAGKIVTDTKQVEKTKTVYTGERKFVKGSAKVVTTDRGIETAGAPVEKSFEGSKQKRSFGDGSTGKKTTIDSDNKSSERGSIYKRRESSGSSPEKSGVKSTEQRKSEMKRQDSPKYKKNSGNNSPSGAAKKSSGSPAKIESTPKKSSPEKSIKKEDAPAKIKKAEPSQNKGSDASPKKSGGSVMKSSGQNNSSAPARINSSPAKTASPSKGSNGSGKGKPGRK